MVAYIFSIFSVKNAKYFPEISKYYKCDDMFSNKLVDSPVYPKWQNASWYVICHILCTCSEIGKRED